MRRVVHLQEPPNDLLDQVLRLVRRQAVLPEQLRIAPPFPRPALLAVPDRLAIPDGDGAVDVARVREAEAELAGRGVEDRVSLDEDGGAQLDRLQGVVEGVDGQGATADAGALFEDGDINGEAVRVGESAEVVCGG